MKLEIGKKYRTHDGDVATVLRRTNDGTWLKVQVQSGTTDRGTWNYHEDGGYILYGQSDKKYSMSIASEITDKKTEPKSDELVKVYKKNNPQYPWGQWTTDMVPPQGNGGGEDEDDQDGDGDGGGEGDDDEDKDEGDGEGEGESEDDNHSTQYAKPYESDGGAEDILTTQKGKLIKYESFDQMINDADDQVKKRSKWSQRASRKTSEPGWSGSKNFQEAISLARYGWNKGMVQMNQVADDFHRRSRWTADRALEWDVAGSHPDVPVFLSGDPCNMINDGDVRKKVKPLIHIMVNKAQHWGIGKDQIFNFGAALMVCIDQIEACGTRVELEAITASLSRDDKYFITQTMLKRAQEPVEKNRLAYAMANPGFLRRLEFSILEQHESQARWDGYYGVPAEMQKDLIPPTALYIPSLQNFEQDAWGDINNSVAALQKFLGIHVGEGGTITMERDAA